MANEMIREQNVEKVLSTAYESFLSEGIEKTTQAMIAHKTGLSLRTVSRYFASKDEMVVLVAKYVLDAVKASPQTTAADLRAMGKSGIELLELYFAHVKAAYLKNPSVYLLRVEFDIYFSRNKVFGNNMYDSVVAETNSRPMLHEIFIIGGNDGTIRCTSDVDFEVRLLCNGYLGFICALALKSAARMEAEDAEEQLDLFFARLLDQYRKE